MKGKMKRFNALAMSFVMVVSVLAGIPSVTASAAPSGYVKSLKISKKSLSMQGGGTQTTVRVTVKTKGKASKKVKVSVSKADKKFVSAKVGKANKKGISKLTIKAKAVTKEETVKVKVTTVGKNKKSKKVSKTISIKISPENVTPTPTPVPVPTPTPTPTPEPAPTPTPEPTPTPTPEPTVIDVTGVMVKAGKAELEIGESTQLSVMVLPDNASDKTVTYTSSNSSVAEVNESGLVTAMAQGTARITATAGQKSDFVDITVNPKKVESVTLDTNTLTLTVNTTKTLIATIAPANASNKIVTWTSSDTSVATVSEGVVKGVSVGTAVITVKTDDGDLTAQCEVTVKQDESSSIRDGIEFSSPDMLGEYSDKEKNVFTTLMGRSLTIQARAMQDGKPLGNKKLKVSIEDLYGWGDDRIYELEGNKTLEYYLTNSDGYVDIPLDLTADNRKQTPSSGDFMSYKITVSYGQVSAEAKAQFASLQVPSPYVVDESSLEMGINAQKAGIWPICVVSGRNELTENMYITSQQVSMPGKDHSVQIAADPFLIIPPSEANEKEKVYTDTIDFASGSYSVYNNDTNEKTTYVSKVVPAGLEWAKIIFSKYTLSEYTKLVVKFYYLDDDNNIDYQTETETMELTGSSNEEKAFQINPKDEKAMRIVVALYSEGQIDDTENDGYVISRLEGQFSGKKTKKGIIQSVDDAVSWEKTNYVDAIETTVTSEELAKYLGEDHEYNDTAQYDYSCTVPDFPNVGNAIISVKKKDTNTVERYFTYYSQNNRRNQNVLSDYNPDDGNAVQISEEEAINHKVGELQFSGNTVTVDSKYTGSTSLRAKLDFTDLKITSKEQLEWYDHYLYSYIQWAPVGSFMLEETENYYAVVGQQVDITARLYDSNGNPVSQDGIELKFSLDNTHVSEQDNEMKLDDFVVGTPNTKTDKRGQTQFSVMNTDQYDFMERLTATTKEYQVRFSVNGSDYKPVVTIQWITPGLYYKSSVDYEDAVAGDAEVIEVYGSERGQATKQMKHKVGKTWQLGTKVIGKLPKKLQENRGWTVYAISGAAPEMMINHIENKVNVDNGIMTLYSEKIGTDNITATLKAESFDTQNIKFILAQLDDDDQIRRDEEGNLSIKEVECVGQGKALGVETVITWPYEWVTNGLKCEVVSPIGQQLEAGVAADVYIKVTDNYKNPMKNYAVTYSITGHTDPMTNVKEEQAKTDEQGYVELSLPAMELPEDTDAQTVSVEVTTPEGVKPLVIRFSRNPIVEGTMKAALAGSKKINVVFSRLSSGVMQTLPISKSTVAPEAFVVKVGGQRQKVIDAVLGEDNETITLTMEKEIPAGEVTVETQKYKDSNKMLKQLLTYHGQSLNGMGVAATR
ncbi:MAG: Ig-like domain-containing protein [Eubacteriales bacterium]|nr:Ig-like domain-containing protein [Eubacteriales bacterium]